MHSRAHVWNINSLPPIPHSVCPLPLQSPHNHRSITHCKTILFQTFRVGSIFLVIVTLRFRMGKSQQNVLCVMWCGDGGSLGSIEHHSSVKRHRFSHRRGRGRSKRAVCKIVTKRLDIAFKHNTQSFSGADGFVVLLRGYLTGSSFSFTIPYYVKRF